jgi:hypothetical protein
LRKDCGKPGCLNDKRSEVFAGGDKVIEQERRLPPLAQRAMERRAGTKGNADQQSTHRMQIRARVTQALGRVRQADQRFAVKHPR